MDHKIILNSEQTRQRALAIIGSLDVATPHELTLKPHKANRNSEQNSKMWAMITEISAQVIWHGQKLTKEEWKDVFTAALKQQKVVPGIESGFVVIGAHTSKMSIADMSELIEFAMAFGCQQGVKWRDYSE